MATLKELRNERLRKLKVLEQLGVNPYSAKANRTHTTAEVTGGYAELEGKPVTVTGRIVAVRDMGKIAFMTIKDAGGQIQLLAKGDELVKADPANSELAFNQLNLLDSGDFIEASGEVIKTKAGEISVGLKTLRLLTKSLRPMPTSWDGFTNKEERLRRRYIDTNVNKEVYERFIRRSKFWQSTRDFLNKEGFIEINIPVLEHTTGGADANPFVTHMDALDQDFYLRISHELPLKRLIGGGYEKVYDIGPRFRNENYSDEHLPEHVAMEFYWAYADWRAGMELTKRLLRYVAKETFGTLKFKMAGHNVDFGGAWEEIDYAQVIKKHYGIDVHTATIEDAKALLKKHRIETGKEDHLPRGIDKLWKEIRKTIAGPAFLVNIPKFLSPLAKAQPENPQLTERVQVIAGGTEVTQSWSELNDPQEQLARFMEQQSMRDAGDDEAQMLDIDYVEMLEYGMPPTYGYGHSERLFWLMEGVSAREGVPFPQLRAEIDEVTKGIYPNIKFKG